jgi:hypothetical protein
MKRDFGSMTWEALRNMHSAWSKGRFHAPDNQIDSEEFDADIERRFPDPRRS